MATYTIHKNNSTTSVVIALEGYGPADEDFAGSFKLIGSFQHDLEKNATAINGDHFLIAGAKEALRESVDFDDVDLNKLVYLDQASNAPQYETDPADADADSFEIDDEQEDPDGGETVAELKERVALITDKDELQKAYEAEQNREKSRSTALAAIEARAVELSEIK